MTSRQLTAANLRTARANLALAVRDGLDARIKYLNARIERLEGDLERDK